MLLDSGTGSGGYLLDAADRIQERAPIPAQLEPAFTVGTMGGRMPQGPGHPPR